MRNFIAVLIILAFVVGIGSYQMLFSVDTKVEEKVTEGEAQGIVVPKVEENFAGTGTLASLLARGESLECSIIYTSPDFTADVEGTYFINNERIRGDFIIPSPEFTTPILSSIIINRNIVHVWSEIEGQKYGFKTDPANTVAIDEREPIPNDVDVQYACKTWTVVDSSIFIPPTDTLFQDPDQLIGEFGTIFETADD